MTSLELLGDDFSSTSREPFLKTVENIKYAVKRSTPSRAVSDNAALLALSWKDTDIPPGPLEAMLFETLTSRLGVKASAYQIPSSSEQEARSGVSNALEIFLKGNDCESAVLVIYYSGHAMIVNGELIIFAEVGLNGEPSVLQIPWGFITTSLEPRGNLLFILDPVFHKDQLDIPQGEITTALWRYPKGEYLSGSGHRSVPDLPIESLTWRLHDILSCTQDMQFTIAQVYALFSRMAPNRQLHICHPFKPSVTLRVRDSRPEGTPSIPGPMGMNFFVLISIQLRGTTDCPELWRAILSKDLPGISIEAVFNSESPLCLLKMPFPVWIMLKGLSGYRFVAQVNTGNLMLEGFAPGGFSLPQRLKRKAED